MVWGGLEVVWGGLGWFGVFPRTLLTCLIRLGYEITLEIRLHTTYELTVYVYCQLPLILTALLHVDLINVAYLTACAFIRSS